MDILNEDITETGKKLDTAEVQLYQFVRRSEELLEICADSERRLHSSALFLPTNLKDAERMEADLEEFSAKFEDGMKEGIPSYTTEMEEVLAMECIDRGLILEWSDKVTVALHELNLLFGRRMNTLEVVAGFYKKLDLIDCSDWVEVIVLSN
ncbi:hypothetical protein PMAYCL1PPCAC_28658 [Pristionchus mayeri]|uniref:Uncharacterized protein n=1 Tax=Pristionchus mayeri TaxID=1317129 RepID=A0AAN5D8I5_9BILA|nr:hypothetical protein PMAYCL1PPCAC_28658 [Pristionchus mayeri]